MKQKNEEGAMRAECDPIPFVTMLAPGTPRNDFPGFVGMRIRIGDDPLTVTALGRMFQKGNRSEHLLKIVKANGYDYRGSEVVVNSGTDGEFTYAELKKPIVLKAHHTYHVVSYEWKNGDYWYTNNTPLFFTPDAVCEGCTYFWAKWNFEAYPNTSYVPVNFKYTVG